MPHQVRKVAVKVVLVEQVLMVLQIKRRSDRFSGLPIRIVLATGHRPDLWDGLARSLRCLVGDRSHEGRIKATRQHDAHRNVGHEALLDALNERFQQDRGLRARIP